MSNTYKDKMKGKYNRFFGWNNGIYIDDPSKELLEREMCDIVYRHGFYGSCPKEWNKLQHIRPERARVAAVLNKVDLDNMGEEISFPHYKRPHHYYW
jgi:hypothetical protein